MLNINPLRTDIFCLPQRFSTFYQVLNNCDEKLTLTSLLAWKHNKIRFCSFKCCQKIPLAIKVHLGIKSDGVRNLVFQTLENHKTLFLVWNLCPILPPPFLADFLKGPQRFLLSKCDNISVLFCLVFQTEGDHTLWGFFLGAICPIICFADSLWGSKICVLSKSVSIPITHLYEMPLLCMLHSVSSFKLKYAK